jgi:hypothetical protein
MLSRANVLLLDEVRLFSPLLFFINSHSLTHSLSPSHSPRTISTKRVSRG